MLFICYPKCSTCQKAEKWLISKGIKFQKRNIKDENPTAEELKKWQSLSKEPLKKFFNTSGMLYRELDMKNKIPTMTDEECFNELAKDGMLVKRPLLVTDKTVLIGFKEAQWEKELIG